MGKVIRKNVVIFDQPSPNIKITSENSILYYRQWVHVYHDAKIPIPRVKRREGDLLMGTILEENYETLKEKYKSLTK